MLEMMLSSRKLLFGIDPHITDTNGIRKDDQIELAKNKWNQMFSIARKNKADIFITGDIIDKVALGNKVQLHLTRLFKENSDIKVYTIWGNHDEYRDNRLLREESALSVMLETLPNLYEYKSCSLETEILAIDFLDSEKINEIIEQGNIKAKVMVAHMFYDNEFMGGETDNITYEQAKKLQELGIKRLILGHDHEPHKDVLIEDISIHRFGNLIRKNRKAYNTWRNVQVMLLDLDSLEYEYIELEQKPFLDVIKSDKIDAAVIEEVDKEELKNLMQNFEKIEDLDQKFEDYLNLKLETENVEVREIVRRSI